MSHACDTRVTCVDHLSCSDLYRNTVGPLLWSVRQAGRQADEISAIYYFFKNLTTSILKHIRLFEWIYGTNSFILIDT